MFARAIQMRNSQAAYVKEQKTRNEEREKKHVVRWKGGREGAYKLHL